MLLLNDTLSPCFVNRYLSSCGILMTRVPPLFRAVSGRAVVAPARSFFNFSESFNKRKEYSERRIIGYVPNQVWYGAWVWFFFIEVHDYVSPSIPANIVYVTGHGNIYCVSFSRYLGFLEYGSVLVISRHHKLLRNRFWQLMPDILEQRISCPTE